MPALRCHAQRLLWGQMAFAELALAVLVPEDLGRAATPAAFWGTSAALCRTLVTRKDDPYETWGSALGGSSS
jgi:hypothetical protein